MSDTRSRVLVHLISRIKVVIGDAFPSSEASAIICNNYSHPVSPLLAFVKAKLQFLRMSCQSKLKVILTCVERGEWRKSSPPLVPRSLLPRVIHTFYSSQEIDFHPKKLSGIHVFFSLPCLLREDAGAEALSLAASPRLSLQTSVNDSLSRP